MAPLIRRILVATDVSATSDYGLEYAHLIARPLGASVHLLHVLVDPLLPEGLVADAYVGESPSQRTTAIAKAQGHLRERSVGMTTTQVLVGQDVETIVAFTMRAAIDLLVMGTHGRTGVAHLLMGSVAERVVRAAPCPVLTVRTHPVAVSGAVPAGLPDAECATG